MSCDETPWPFTITTVLSAMAILVPILIEYIKTKDYSIQASNEDELNAAITAVNTTNNISKKPKTRKPK